MYRYAYIYIYIYICKHVNMYIPSHPIPADPGLRRHGSHVSLRGTFGGTERPRSPPGGSGPRSGGIELVLLKTGGFHQEIWGYIYITYIV